MNFPQFVCWANERGRRRFASNLVSAHRDLTVCALGFAGEAGEVVEHFKKYIRDDVPVVGNMDLALELGDALHYWVRLCNYAGFTPEEIMAANMVKLEARDEGVI